MHMVPYLQQVSPSGVELRRDLSQALNRVIVRVGRVIGERCHVGPALLGRCAQHFKYSLELIVHIRPGKQRSASVR